MAGVPCWLAKKLRPLPVHSWTDSTVVRGSRRRSSHDSDSAADSGRGVASPSPKTRSRHVLLSMTGVEVWLRTNSRAWSVR